MKKTLLFSLTMIALLYDNVAKAQDIRLVDDYYSGHITQPYNLTVFKNKLFFHALGDSVGSELWVTDGTLAGTHVFKDISITPFSSSPGNLKVANNLLFFCAGTGAAGRELWVTDTASSTTVLLKDIRPGTFSSNPEYMAVIDNKLFFYADNGTDGREPWISDGTVSGTVMLKDICTLPGCESFSYPNRFVYNGKLYFNASNDVYGDEIWVTDGTTGGTQLLKDINPGAAGSSPTQFIECNGKLFFTANDGTNGFELWCTDGTAAGTAMVKDINPTGDGYPGAYFVFNSRLYFNASDDGTTGYDMWQSDGTAAGTTPMDVNPFGNFQLSEPVVFNGKIYFQGDNGAGSTGIYSFDGISNPMFTNIGGGFSYTVFNNRLFFRSSAFISSGISGRNLWSTDGTVSGTTYHLPAIGTPTHTNPLAGTEEFVEFKGSLYFAAGYDYPGEASLPELWRFDPDTATAINEISINSRLLVYPNPNNGTFHIFSENIPVGQLINVYDVFGKLVADFRLEEQEVRLSHLSKGIYFLRPQAAPAGFSKIIIQ